MGMLKNLRPCTTCQECVASPCSAPKPVVSSGSRSGAQGSAFSFTISATNSPTSYAATGLPGTLSINTSTGVISGTYPSCGVFPVTIKASNGCGEGTNTLSISSTGTVPVFTSSGTASGTIAVAFSFNLTATGSPHAFDASPLPAGLSVNTSTGVISGTPTAVGVTSLTVSAINTCAGSTNTLTITISAACPMPTMECDSISASRSKYGHSEFEGYESNPPRLYLRHSWTGTLDDEFYTDPCDAYDSTSSTTFAGYCEYNTDGTIGADTKTVDGSGAGTYCGTYNLARIVCPSADCMHGDTATSFTVTGRGTCALNHLFNGDVADTLSNEFTTADLISLTVADLPAYPGTWSGSCSAYRELDSDELSYTIRRIKYRFRLPDMTGITAYTISWVMGGVSALSYVWDGVASVTGEYIILEPSVNGEPGITNVAVTCS